MLSIKNIRSGYVQWFLNCNDKVLKMNNLIEIQNQIAKLQKQADEIRAQEFDKGVQEILAKMAAYGVTVKDLEPASRRTRKPASQIAQPVAVKFRGPNSETWSGRGLMPRWLTALVAGGRKPEDFAV